MELTDREELMALKEADFRGIPREALVATIHYLAEKMLGFIQERADDYAER